MEQEVLNSKNTKKTGDLGESLACRYLQDNDHFILDRNFWRKWGELDIVSQKDDVVHFVEVKTVSYETITNLEWAVTHETWRPEEQVHRFKLHQIEKALETWLQVNNWSGNWQIDVIGVRIVPRETYCTVNLLENITII